MTEWRDEYLRRVAEALTPEHAAHGFRSDAEWFGYDPSGCDTCGNVGSIEVRLSGTCPCGQRLWVSVDGEGDVAAFMRKITND